MWAVGEALHDQPAAQIDSLLGVGGGGQDDVGWRRKRVPSGLIKARL
jgi:hypothetical protein